MVNAAAETTGFVPFKAVGISYAGQSELSVILNFAL
jgi:hypothetical protein